MRLKNLQGHNFGSFADFDRSFKDEEDLIGILGWWANNPKKSIGSGKSTFIELILYIRYGRSRTGKAVESLIKTGTSGMWGSMTIITPNLEEVYVKRETKLRGTDKNKASSKMVVEVNGIRKADGVIACEEYLDTIFDIPYETFVATSFFVQEKADAFTSATATERKGYVRRLEPDTAIFEEARQRGVKELTKLELQIAQEKAILDSMQSETGTFDKKALQQEIFNLEKEISDKQSNLTVLQDHQVEYEKQKAQVELKKAYEANLVILSNDLRQINEDIQEKTDEINRCTKNIETYNKSLVNTSYDQNELEWAKIELDDIKDAKAKLQANREVIIDRIKLAESGRCDRCGKPTNDIDITDLREKVAMYDKEILEKDTDNNNIKIKIKQIEVNKEIFDTNKNISLQIEHQEKQLALNNDQLKVLNQRHSSKKKQYDELKKTIDTITVKPLVDNSVAIKDITSTINDLHNSVGEKRALINNIDSILKKTEQKIKDIGKISKDIDIMRDVIYAFGKDGIPNLIVEGILAEIEEIANQIVADISPEIRIYFITQKESKKKSTIETLDIMVSFNDHMRLYETYSGGERTIVNFAIRFAISYYMSQKLGIKTRAVEMVVLDEVFGSLCEDGREKIIAVLQTLKKKFKQIFVISHSDLKEIFPYTIQIERTREESKVIN